MGSPTVNINVGFSEPPIQTPLLLQKSPVYAVPYHMQGGDGDQDASVAANAALINYPWAGWVNSLFQKVSNGPLIAGTRANRLALPAQNYTGDLYMETDTGLIYAAFASVVNITGATNASPIVISAVNNFIAGDVVFDAGVLGNVGANGNFTISTVSGTNFTLVGSHGTGAYTSGGTATGPVRWNYISGMVQLPSSALAAFAATLTAADTGLLVFETDTRHIFRWSGAAFVLAPGDVGNAPTISQTITAPVNIPAVVFEPTVSSSGANDTKGLVNIPTEPSVSGAGVFYGAEFGCNLNGPFNETSVVAVQVDTPTVAAGATLTTAFGVLISPQKIAAGTLGYAIYQSGTNDESQFFGTVRFNGPLIFTNAAAVRTALGAVSRTTAITAPSGGTTIDTQARTAINAIITALNS